MSKPPPPSKPPKPAPTFRTDDDTAGCALLALLLALGFALASVTLLSGCMGEGGYIPVRLRSDIPTHEAMPILEEAEAILGTPILLVPYKRGAITVRILAEAPPAGVQGSTPNRGRRCTPRLWSAPHAPTLAHEIGHALQLAHVDGDQSNVMAPFASADFEPEISDEQLSEIDHAVRLLNGCAH